MHKLVTTLLLEEVVSPKLLVNLRQDQRFKIEVALVKHVIGLTNYIEYIKEIGGLLPVTERKILRQKALDSFPIMVQLKHSLLQILTLRLSEQPDTDAVFARFNLGDHAALIDGLRMQRIYSKAVLHAKTALLRFDSEEAVRHKCGEIVTACLPHSRRYARKKFRFIVRHNNVSMDDMICELQMKAVQAFYHVIPLLNRSATNQVEDIDLYLTNTMRVAINNHGSHMIKYYTAECRKRLGDEDSEGGHTAIVKDLYNDNFRDGQADATMDTRQESEELFREAEYQFMEQLNKTESALTYSDFFSTHGRQPLKRKVLELLSMQEDRSFTERAFNMYPEVVKRTYDTQQLFGKLGRARFLKVVRLHAGVEKRDFYDFLRVLEKSF